MNQYPIQTYVGYLVKSQGIEIDEVIPKLIEKAVNKEILIKLYDGKNYQIFIDKENDPLVKQKKAFLLDKKYEYEVEGRIISGKKGRYKQQAGRDVLHYLNEQNFVVNKDIYEKFKNTPSEFVERKEKGKLKYDLVNLGTMSWKEVKDKSFYFRWIYDFRGRLNSYGYELNPHGGELQRYGLDFASTKPLTKAGLDAVYMHISTLFGLDKLVTEERIRVGKLLHETYPPKSIEPSKEPIQLGEYTLEKSIAYYKIPDMLYVGMPWSIPVEFDVTNSGLQIMSAFTGCKNGCRLTNLTHNDKPYDSYTDIATGLGISRKEIKKPMMSHFYNSVKGVRNKLGTLYPNFVKEVSKTFEGPTELLEWFKAKFDNKDKYVWELPDSFIVQMDQYNKVTAKIGDPTYFKVPFTFEFYQKGANNNHRPLLVNIIHSLDAYLNRAVIRAFAKRAKPIAPVHDAWLIHPNDLMYLKKSYKQAFEDLLDRDWLVRIIKQVYGREVKMPKLDKITSDYFII